MRCHEVQQLFDAYLDGELSPTLANELSAHRLHCADCRRALALLEVSGHVLSGDGEPVELRADFTDRLIACVDRPKHTWMARMRIGLYVGGPLAAAAVIGLAFLGVFDGQRNTRRAGVAVDVQDVDISGLFEAEAPAPGFPGSPEHTAGVDEWMQRLQRNVEIKRESGASLQRAIELQLQNLLDAAERGTDRLGDTGPAAEPQRAPYEKQDPSRSPPDPNP